MNKSLLLFVYLCTISAQTAAIRLVHYENKVPATEVISGNILINDKDELTVPDVFTYIADSKSGYRFIQRETASGREGYFPIEPVTIRQSSTLINDDQLNQEYYKSPVRLKNTPEDWLYGICSEGSFFFSARGMFRLIRKYKPAAVSRFPLQN